MLTIQEYINRELIRKDEVRLPLIGVLRIKRTSAKFNSSGNLLHPPHYSLNFEFDALTRANDDSLDWNAWYRKVNRAIDDKGEFPLGHWGNLEKDNRGRIFFIPSTAIDSKLHEPQAIPLPTHNIQKDQEPEPAITAVKSEEPEELIPVIQTEKKRRRLTRAAIWIIPIFILGAGAAWLFRDHLVPDLKTSGTKVHVNNDLISFNQEIPESVDPSIQVTDIPANQELAEIKEILEHEPEPVQPAEEIKVENRTGFYIVLGAFKKEMNASRFSEKLRNEGLDVLIIPSRTFNRVGIPAGEDRVQADHTLKEIRSQGYGKAWLYEH